MESLLTDLLKFIVFFILVVLPIFALGVWVGGRDDILLGNYKLTRFEEFKDGRLEVLPKARAYMIVLRGHLIRMFPVITEPGSPAFTTYINGEYESFPSSKTAGLVRVVTDNGEHSPKVVYFGYAKKKDGLELSEYMGTEEYYIGTTPLRRYFWRTS